MLGSVSVFLCCGVVLMYSQCQAVQKPLSPAVLLLYTAHHLLYTYLQASFGACVLCACWALEVALLLLCTVLFQLLQLALQHQYRAWFACLCGMIRRQNYVRAAGVVWPLFHEPSAVAVQLLANQNLLLLV
jgi:hypothetical protein